MFFGYNTNGFAHHRLEDIVVILAEQGYRGIALTVDYHTINLGDRNWIDRIPYYRDLFERYQMRVVIETGARFLLDPRRKHQPTLLSPVVSERLARLDFLQACGRLANELGADAVSFWSGSPTDHADPPTWMNRLVEMCRLLCDSPKGYQTRWAFEPEPGMFIDTMDRFAELFTKVDHPQFGLTLDIGHLQCNGELPISQHLHTWKDRLWNIHIEDMKRGIHDHLPFGEGEVDFVDLFAGLRSIDYQGGLYVELSRHSHNAVEVAKQSLAFMQRAAGLSTQ